MASTWTKFLLVICFMADACLGQLCGPNVTYEPLDIRRASRVTHSWHDVISILPGNASSITHCSDVTYIQEVFDGFVMTLTIHVEGRPAADSLDTYIHFIDNGNGTYRSNPDWVSAFVDTARISFKHIADETYMRDLERSIGFMHEGNFFFITDYDKYFIMGKCIPGLDTIALITHKNKQPTGSDVIDLWNLFSEYGESPKPNWEGACNERKVTKQELQKKKSK